MKNLITLICFTFFISCNTNSEKTIPIESEKKAINTLLDGWHKAASDANAEGYFSKMDSISVFIGTDATENWSKKEFEAFSKPYFEKGKAWSFTSVERNVYLSKDGNFAWFDELLDTWMGICRGSGFLEKKNDQWLLKHFVLSVTVPNDDIQKLIDVKLKKDQAYIQKLTIK